jgi:hypothetical protein
MLADNGDLVFCTMLREVTMHLRSVGVALAGALAVLGAMASDVSAQRRDRDDDRGDRRGRDDNRGDRRGRDDLVLLGEQAVGFRVDRDILRIGQSEDWYRDRRFKALYFQAQGNDVHMISIRLVYMNGFGEDYRVDRLIRQGDDLPIDLRGERSYLRQIEMVYRARPDFGGRAVIRVYGEPSRRPGPPPMPAPGPSAGRDWVELGCQQVALFGKDRDAIRVGRREGRFKAIRLHVRGADVEMLDLKVVYSNGQPDDLPVRNLIRQGERTRPLDLKGWERSIDRVEMVYRTAVNPVDIIAKQRISTANVCVEGLQ